MFFQGLSDKITGAVSAMAYRLFVALACAGLAIIQTSAPSHAGAEFGNDLNPGFTSSVASRANNDLDKCRSASGGAKQNCVAQALKNLSSRLAAHPAYSSSAGIIRRAARSVRAARTVRQAVAAVETARRKLLRATGKLLREHRKLAGVMQKAKSILKS